MNEFDIVFKLDSSFKVLFANDTFYEVLKLEKSQVRSITLFDIISPEYRSNIEILHENLLKDSDKKHELEIPCQSGSGEKIWLRITIQKSSSIDESLKFIAIAKDHTDRIYTKKLVLSNEQKYREIIENIDLGLMEVDLAENILFANESFCKSTGYTLEEIKGKNASKVFAPEDVRFQKLIGEHNDLRMEGKSTVYEMSLTKKDGTHAWMMISGAPVKDINGKVVGSIGIHHDITSRKLEEINKKSLLKELESRNKELIKNQEFLKAINDFVTGLMHSNNIEDIVHNITQGTIEKFQFEDCVVYLMNEQKTELHQITAYGPKNNNGKINNPIVIPLGQGIVGSVAKSGRAEIINDTSKDPRYIVDDEMRYSELAVPIISDEEVIGVIDSEHSQKNFFKKAHLETLTTIANLSATKIKSSIIRSKKSISDRALIESEEKLRSIINSSLDAVITIDESGIVTEWNPQAIELFNFSKEEAIGEKLSNLIIPEEFRAMHDKGMEHWRKTGEGPVLNKRIEIVGINKEGLSFPIELSIVPVKSKGKHFFSAFVRDITPRKEAEKQMHDALEKQKELVELKSRFVSMTSHEFRTPLTTVKVNIELIEYQLEKLNAEMGNKFRKNFSRIASEVKRLTELMDDILIIGRIESGKTPFKPKKINIVEFIRQIVDTSFSKRRDGRKVEFFSNENEIEGMIDPHVYDHIVCNLLSNALKYSKGKANPEIHLNKKDDCLEIRVRDYGIGIPEHDLENIFDSFYRASNVENIQGTGLGLAIVKEYAEMHNASLSIESILNKGTEITIKQPIESNTLITAE